MSGKKEWMLGLPGHNNVVSIDEVLLLVKGGQLRPTDLVKKLGSPWRAASEVPELAEYFADGPRKTEAPKPATSVPKAAAPPEPEAETPKPEPARAEPAKAPPARETRSFRREEPVAAAPKETPPVLEKSAEPPAPRKTTRPIPKPPPPEEPLLEPMVAKYFSPVDMLRCASHAFDPKRMTLTAAGSTGLMLLWSLAMHLSLGEDSTGKRAVYLAGWAVAALGVAFIMTALAFVSRRQLEGQGCGVMDAVRFMLAHRMTALVYPVLVAIPSLLAVGVLWIMGLLRNSSTALASVLKLLYIVPMLFALVCVLGALVFQVASMYVPAAAAIEGLGLSGSVNAAWNHVRRQWGRVLLHWLIVTVAVGVIGFVCMGLAAYALVLPEMIFPAPKDFDVLRAWMQFGGVMAVYRGVALGLGLALPLSLLSTLGCLSYVSLRHPVGAQLSPAPPEETHHEPGSTTPAPLSPMEATQPSETRPAPPGYDGDDSKPATKAGDEKTDTNPEAKESP